jgi:hypothetical protein
VEAGNPALFLIFEERLSIFHHWVPRSLQAFCKCQGSYPHSGFLGVSVMEGCWIVNTFCVSIVVNRGGSSLGFANVGYHIPLDVTSARGCPLTTWEMQQGFPTSLPLWDQESTDPRCWMSLPQAAGYSWNNAQPPTKGLRIGDAIAVSRDKTQWNRLQFVI